MNKRTLLTAACSMVLLGGCATTTSPVVRGDGSSRGAMASSAGTPVSRPAPVRSSRVTAEISPRGSVPYDMQTLPLVSPDGRFIATQSQIAPTWPTVLAQHNAQVPYATRIEIYSIDGDAPEFLTSVDAPVLLGRSFNRDGFVVESQNEDGSRWIGLAAWETGAITWLVMGNAVNAFASIGPDGRLAWNRREIDAPEGEFDLVIRRGQDEWSLHSPHEQWLMPTWSGRGDGLFALTLSGGELSAVYATASSEIALRQSRRGIHLASGASLYTAYQTIGAQVNSPDVPCGEQFMFHHPSRARMALWRPRAGTALLTFFDSNTFAAILEDDEHALVTTDRHLIRQNLREMRDRREVLAGMQVPRPTGSANWQYILLTPQNDAIGITAMNRLD